jgi:hypothetical protein
MGRGEALTPDFSVVRSAPDTSLDDSGRASELYARRHALDTLTAIYEEAGAYDKSLLAPGQARHITNALIEGAPREGIQKALMALLIGRPADAGVAVGSHLRLAKVLMGLQAPFSEYVVEKTNEDLFHLIAKPRARTSLCGLRLDEGWRVSHKPRGSYVASEFYCEACDDRAMRRGFGDPVREAATETIESAGYTDQEAVALLTLSLASLEEDAKKNLGDATLLRYLQEVEKTRKNRLFKEAALIAATEFSALPDAEKGNAFFRRWKDDNITEEASLGEMMSYYRKSEASKQAPWPDVETLTEGLIYSFSQNESSKLGQRAALCGWVAIRYWPEVADPFLRKPLFAIFDQASPALLRAIQTV